MRTTADSKRTVSSGTRRLSYSIGVEEIDYEPAAGPDGVEHLPDGAGVLLVVFEVSESW